MVADLRLDGKLRQKHGSRLAVVSHFSYQRATAEPKHVFSICVYV